ncbi:ubiquitin-conjugating enzyme E2 1 [Trichinella spiralis]|uniref:ubiquitin-conjugating enzyme E2 1 n=1 Tax=Trichinella spiralis TaxID=6334 RepID=UPI0001EFD374|nr:ubiquitin-conjugating enzyme E2 1 [Trichinella spiralis]
MWHRILRKFNNTKTHETNIPTLRIQFYKRAALPTAVHIKFGNDDSTLFNNDYDESTQNISTTHKSEETQHDENSQNPTSVKEPIPSMEPGNKEAENKMEMENSAPVENEFLPPLNATIKENIPSISTTQISQNGETNIQLQPESIPTKDADSDKQFSVAVNKQIITTIEEIYEHLNETHVETLPEENANLPNEEQQTQQETFAPMKNYFMRNKKLSKPILWTITHFKVIIIII